VNTRNFNFTCAKRRRQREEIGIDSRRKDREKSEENIVLDISKVILLQYAKFS